MKKSLALLSVACLSLALSACGGKDEATTDVPKVAAGEDVPAPAGKNWADMVVATEKGGYLMGNPDATIKVTEFGSYTCPHCADFTEKSADDVQKMVNSGKMSFEFRPFVRDAVDMTMTLIAGCNGPETYFPFSHQLFGNQAAVFEKLQGAGDAAYTQAMSQPPQDRFIALAQLTGLIDFAKQRGLAEDKAKQCLADGKQAETIAAHVQDATTSYNISGTPTLLINDKVVENAASWDVLKEKLTEAGL
ncbi:MAG: thioredoxin domain-containing protein [Sphingobium sp.]